MASLRDIKKRIRSVNGSQKITKAMKLVAASKLKRAQDAITQARPYAERITALVARTAARAQSAQQDDEAVHPLLAVRPLQRAALVVVSSDRGSCGAFNSNVLRQAERFLEENAGRIAQVEVITVGRKAREHFAKRKGVVTHDEADIFGELTFARVQQLADRLIGRFVAGSLDAVVVLYNEAQSAMSQKVVLRDVLPALPEAMGLDGGPQGDAAAADVGFEALYAPDRQALLEKLVPTWVAVQLNRALLESVAAEHGARMTAMEAATKNAQELVETLTLQYNRVRQAAITTELMDIIGGAEALAG